MKLNRFMLAACASGSGKTLLTCGMLRLLQRKQLNIVSFKCGPDYIDPAFHAFACGKKGYNLDPFFMDQEGLCRIMALHGQGQEMALVEGVMGYYDGLSLDSNQASSCQVAEWTDTPVILIVNGAGMSRSVLAQIRGFLEYQEKPCIKGIFLNKISPAMAKMLAGPIRENFGIPVVGSLPKMPDVHLESRHLGLLMPEEVQNLNQQIDMVADQLEESLDYQLLMQIAGSAEELPDQEKGKVESNPLDSPSDSDDRVNAKQEIAQNLAVEVPGGNEPDRKVCRVAVARDEAFCFFYQDNLRILREHGLEPVFFSPIHDQKLPENIQGMILYGGYPEIYAQALSQNSSMREQIRQAAMAGMPLIGECGGFLYLHRNIKDTQGKSWPMAGLLPYDAENKGKLQRFGYVTLTGPFAFGRKISPMPAHEFHYYDSEDPGSDFLAVKPNGRRKWNCIHSSQTMFLGFPHLYYAANEEFAEAFAQACRKYAGEEK